MNALPAASDKIFHPDLVYASQRYRERGILIDQCLLEQESTEYGAATFNLHSKRVKFRVAKQTPKKSGFFVAIWERENGVTRAPTLNDPFDLLVISVNDHNGFGHFVFNKKMLIRHKIVATDLTEGKRGIRVYPPWVDLSSKQALNTQKWQCEHFVDLSSKDFHSQLIDLIT